MSKIPEKAPDWRDRKVKAIGMADHPDVIPILRKANERYYYWDKFRAQPFPADVDRKTAWACLKVQREGQLQELPLRDVTGRPFRFWLPEHLQDALHQIDRWLAPTPLLPRHLIHSLIEEASTSSQVEGAATTLRVAKRMLLTGRQPRDRSERMIYNNFQAMEAIKDYADQPLSHDLLQELHGRITEGTLDSGERGRYRLEGEDVRVETMQGETVFVPPPADRVDADLNALIDFANDGELDRFIHPVVRAIFLHFALAYIHPFIDGNGRMARALFYWYMIKAGYWYFEYLSISKVILRRLGQYGRAYLYTETDEADLTYFLHFNLKVIADAVESLHTYLVEEQEQLADEVAIPGLNLRQSRIVLHALKKPREVFTIKQHQTSSSVAYQTARTDLLGLEEEGLLNRVKKGNSFYFIVPDDLQSQLENE